MLVAVHCQHGCPDVIVRPDGPFPEFARIGDGGIDISQIQKQ